MPTWDQLLQVVAQQNAYDQLRKQYIRKLSKLTNRNVICYYSGWLQKPNINGDFSISDQDKTGFMTCMYDEKERKKGLDLILHTPGGDVGATESLIDYLNTLYEGNIRTIVPQIAMSGGTLLALSGKEIVMGSQSSLGPVDPQYGGMAVQSYLDEFDRANKEVVNDKTKEAVWQMIIGQFHPGFLTWCERAMEWSVEILETVLKNNMLRNDDSKIQNIKKLLVDQRESKAHNRHINRDKAGAAGIKIVNLEDNQKLQDVVLTLHHLFSITFQQTTSAKIIASGANGGRAYVARSNPMLTNKG